ncbi:MAG: TonB family protein, partial [Paracoccus sp. (in: a-proteobacteria)]|nr:TonB family protein [Paracoccus sp. (in: a-proteobacteria)]
QGTRAMVTFTVTRGGRIQSPSLTGSSGNARVDQQILRAVQRAGSCPAAPAGLTDATYRFSLPFRVG